MYSFIFKTRSNISASLSKIDIRQPEVNMSLTTIEALAKTGDFLDLITIVAKKWKENQQEFSFNVV